MNPITALMLSEAIEAERRREINHRRDHRVARTAGDTDRDRPGRRPWSLRLPRFGLAGSKG